MNLALSNLCWDYYENDLVFEKMNKVNINNIELVLTKLSDWDSLNENLIFDFSKKIESVNLKVKTMQSLFYNLKCESICDESVVLPHFQKLINYCKILSCETLVFGSPNLRNKVCLQDNKINKIFYEIDNLLNNHNIELSIEPNSKLYNGDFFYNIEEIVFFLKKNNYKNIKTMIDTHNLINEKLSPEVELEKNFKYINHIHVSENNLDTIKDLEFHKRFSNKIKKTNYDKIITYEVKKQKNVWESVEVFKNIYG